MDSLHYAFLVIDGAARGTEYTPQIFSCNPHAPHASQRFFPAADAGVAFDTR